MEEFCTPEIHRALLSHKTVGNVVPHVLLMVYHLNLNINQKKLALLMFFLGEENAMRHEALDFVVEFQVLLAVHLLFQEPAWELEVSPNAVVTWLRCPQTMEWPGVWYSIPMMYNSGMVQMHSIHIYYGNLQVSQFLIGTMTVSVVERCRYVKCTEAPFQESKFTKTNFKISPRQVEKHHVFLAKTYQLQTPMPINSPLPLH